jgi:hypothetical protein
MEVQQIAPNVLRIPGSKVFDLLIRAFAEPIPKLLASRQRGRLVCAVADVLEVSDQ